MKVKLSPAETNLLFYIRKHSEAIFSGALSTIALDKHKYAVDENTKFELNADLTELEISQVDQTAKAAPKDEETGVKAAK